MPPKSARMRSGGIRPSFKSEAAAPVHPTHVESDPAFDFLAMVPSPVTFPASKSARMRSGGIIPSPPKEQATPSTLDASDSVFEFLKMVPSPVTFPLSDQATSSAVHTTADLSLAQPAPPQSERSDGDPFAFLDLVPSPVNILPSQECQSAPSPPHPPPSQRITLPAHMGAGDSLISFMAKLNSQNALRSDLTTGSVRVFLSCFSWSSTIILHTSQSLPLNTRFGDTATLREHIVHAPDEVCAFVVPLVLIDHMIYYSLVHHLKMMMIIS